MPTRMLRNDSLMGSIGTKELRDILNGSYQECQSDKS